MDITSILTCTISWISFVFWLSDYPFSDLEAQFGAPAHWVERCFVCLFLLNDLSIRCWIKHTKTLVQSAKGLRSWRNGDKVVAQAAWRSADVSKITTCEGFSLHPSPDPLLSTLFRLHLGLRGLICSHPGRGISRTRLLYTGAHKGTRLIGGPVKVILRTWTNWGLSR